MSGGYRFWSDMSIGDFLNGKVKSVNNYIIYGTNVLNRIIFYFLCIQISYFTNRKEKKYALFFAFKSQTKNM